MKKMAVYYEFCQICQHIQLNYYNYYYVVTPVS